MKTDIKLVLMTIIAMFAMIGGFSWAVSLQIGPLKENQTRFEAELKEIKAQFRAELKEIKREFGAELKEIKALLMNQSGIKPASARKKEAKNLKRLAPVASAER